MQALDDVAGAAKGFSSRLEGATKDVTKQAQSIVADASGSSSSTLDANTTNVLTAVVAGVLVVGAAYYLYQEYQKKKGEEKSA
jgi:cytochrome c-type biogenesis protein CcmH/NrfG